MMDQKSADEKISDKIFGWNVAVVMRSRDLYYRKIIIPCSQMHV